MNQLLQLKINRLLIGMVAFLLLLGAYGCRKDEMTDDNIDELSPMDQAAFKGLQTAYANAKTYNDSLIWCADTSHHCLDSLIHHYDNWYHHHDSLFNHHHNNYSHDNDHDDHHHDHHGMHHHGDNDNHDHLQGHHEHDHELMDSLRHTHGPYHP